MIGSIVITVLVIAGFGGIIHLTLDSCLGNMFKFDDNDKKRKKDDIPFFKSTGTKSAVDREEIENKNVKIIEDDNMSKHRRSKKSGVSSLPPAIIVDDKKKSLKATTKKLTEESAYKSLVEACYGLSIMKKQDFSNSVVFETDLIDYDESGKEGENAASSDLSSQANVNDEELNSKQK